MMKFPYIHPRNKKWYTPELCIDPDFGPFVKLVDSRVIANVRATETWMQIYGHTGGYRQGSSKLLTKEGKLK